MNTTAPVIPDTLTFVAPILGFSHLREFDVARLDEDERLFTLRSTGPGARRWFVIEPTHLFPTYHPTIPGQYLEALELDEASSACLLVIVNEGTHEVPTANLLAPVVVNPDNGWAAQVVLEDDTWAVDVPLNATARGLI